MTIVAKEEKKVKPIKEEKSGVERAPERKKEVGDYVSGAESGGDEKSEGRVPDSSAETHPVEGKVDVNADGNNGDVQPDRELFSSDASANTSVSTECSDSSDDLMNPMWRGRLEMRERGESADDRSEDGMEWSPSVNSLVATSLLGLGSGRTPFPTNRCLMPRESQKKIYPPSWLFPSQNRWLHAKTN